MQQHAEKLDLLGKLCPGDKKLEGMTFYLDGVKKRPTALLLEAICLLGGRVESFLHKDVSFVVTGSQEGQKEQKCTDINGGAKRMNEEAQRLIKQRETILKNDRQQPVTPRPMACGSRGKALLEKAISNNERLQGSSVLANARSWGVKILYVDDVLLYLKKLSRESFSRKHKRPEKSCTKQQGSRVVKAAALRSPYLKIEDLSRKYRPLHIQSMTFPSLCYSGRYSPFETPPPPRFEKRRKEKKNKTREKKEVESTSQDKSLTPISCNPSPWQPRKKDVSYCECCQQPFTNLQEHLQSEQHRTFVLDPSNYSVVDKLVADMLPGFNPSPSELSEETLNRPPTTSLPIHDVCELEPLSDVETERAVQALQRQGSSFSICISSPTRAPLSFGPAGPSPGSQFPIPNPDTLRGDIQSFSPTECQFPVIQPHTPSPAILDVKPQAHDLASQQPDFPHLSPCPQTPPPAPDPYSLPPLLSPQAPYSSIMEPHNLYSEPPVLSPQQYIVEEAVEGVICEMDSAECLSKSVSAVTLPVSTTLLPSVAVTNAEGVKGSNQDGLFLLSGFVCSSSGLDCDKLASCRSRSLSRQSATAANRKKRCRSASPECSLSKTRRVTATFDYSSRWTELYHTSANPERDIMAKPEGCLLFDQTSCQMIQSCPNPNVSSVSSLCAVETVGLKETSTTFCAPAVQNLTQAPNQIDILCHDSTSVAHQPSWPLSSKTKFFDPPLQFSSDKPQNCPSSLSQSTSVCIESTLIPDLATLSPSSSDSDWDCDLLSRLGPTLATSLPPTEQSCELDKDLLQRPCTWMHDTSYESHLHTALHMSTPTASLCGEETDPSAFSRTLVQIVKVQH